MRMVADGLAAVERTTSRQCDGDIMMTTMTIDDGEQDWTTGGRDA
jgi:hypothetical protein